MKTYSTDKGIRNIVIIRNRERWKEEKILVADSPKWDEGKNKNIMLSPNMVAAIINLINFSKNP